MNAEAPQFANTTMAAKNAPAPEPFSPATSILGAPKASSAVNYSTIGVEVAGAAAADYLMNKKLRAMRIARFGVGSVVYSMFIKDKIPGLETVDPRVKKFVGLAGADYLLAMAMKKQKLQDSMAASAGAVAACVIREQMM